MIGIKFPATYTSATLLSAFQLRFVALHLLSQCLQEVAALLQTFPGQNRQDPI
jgi:hypothetical protein